MTLIGLSTVYSQTDSVKCFTIEEQRIIVKKILQAKECLAIQKHQVKELQYKDSIISNDKRIIGELEAKNEITLLAYSNEKKQRETTEKALVKSNRQRNRWRTLTGIVGASGIIAYFLK